MVYTTAQKKEIKLEFEEGDEVECFYQTWIRATVVQCWYREKEWPPETWSPYQLQLEDGGLIFAPALHAVRTIQRENMPVTDEAKHAASPTAVGSSGTTRTNGIAGTRLESADMIPAGSADSELDLILLAQELPCLHSVSSVGSVSPRSDCGDDDAEAPAYGGVPRGLNYRPPSFDGGEFDALTLDVSADPTQRVATHGKVLPNLFSTDDTQFLENDIDGMQLEENTDEEPWRNEMGLLPLAKRSPGECDATGRVYKMALSRSMTDEVVGLSATDEDTPRGVREPVAIETASLLKTDGQWASFPSAAPTEAQSKRRGLDAGRMDTAPAAGRSSGSAAGPRPSIDPWLPLHGPGYQEQRQRLKELRQMLLHARSVFGTNDQRYLEIRRRILCCEAQLATYTAPRDAAANPLSASASARLADDDDDDSAPHLHSPTAKRPASGEPGKKKVKKKRVMPHVADRQRAKPWTDEELADFRRMLSEEGPGDWASKAARLTASHGAPRSVKSLHSRWLREEGRIIDQPRGLMSKGLQGIKGITTQKAMKGAVRNVADKLHG